MESTFFLLNLLICLIEAFLMVDFYAAFFRLRENVDCKYTKWGVIVGAAALVRLVNCLNSTGINLLAMQIIYFSILLIFFKGSLPKKIFCFLVTDIIMIGVEFLWMVMMSHPADYYIYQVQDNKIREVIGLLGMKGLAFFFFNLLKRLSKKMENRMQVKTLLLYCSVPLATVGIMVSLAYMNYDYAGDRFLQNILEGSSILVIIGNMALFYIFDNYVVTQDKVRKQELIIARMEMEEKRYEQIEAVNREHAGFLHDIRHHLRTIGAMAAEKRTDEILEIIPQLQVKVSDAAIERFCPNSLLNTIINEKKRECENNNLDFKLTIEPDFGIDWIDKTDVIVILNNLFENAIEAATKCENGYVKSFFFCQNDGHFSIIKIINNYCGEIVVQDGLPVSSKQDKTLHGYGVSNVMYTVKKNGGSFQYSYEEGVFTAVVVLPKER